MEHGLPHPGVKQATPYRDALDGQALVPEHPVEERRERRLGADELGQFRGRLYLDCALEPALAVYGMRTELEPE